MSHPRGKTVFMCRTCQGLLPIQLFGQSYPSVFLEIPANYRNTLKMCLSNISSLGKKRLSRRMSEWAQECR